MSKETITSVLKVRGTAADRTAFKITDIPEYQEVEFTETDTDDVYIGSQDGWAQSKKAGRVLVATPAFTGLSTAALTTLAAGYVTAGTTAEHMDDEYKDIDLGYKVKFDGVSAFVRSGYTLAGATAVTLATTLSGEDVINNVTVVEQGQFQYEVVPVTTQTTLGATGAAGDFLHVILAADATTQVVIKDGAVTVYTWVRAAGAKLDLEFNGTCATNWNLTCTGGGATAFGRFT